MVDTLLRIVSCVAHAEGDSRVDSDLVVPIDRLDTQGEALSAFGRRNHPPRSTADSAEDMEPNLRQSQVQYTRRRAAVAQHVLCAIRAAPPNTAE